MALQFLSLCSVVVLSFLFAFCLSFYLLCLWFVHHFLQSFFLPFVFLISSFNFVVLRFSLTFVCLFIFLSSGFISSMFSCLIAFFLSVVLVLFFLFCFLSFYLPFFSSISAFPDQLAWKLNCVLKLLYSDSPRRPNPTTLAKWLDAPTSMVATRYPETQA